MPIKCSACILTFNSEKTLEKCLDSVRDFSDILVLDGGSMDGTLQIAKKYNARVLPQSEAASAVANFTVVRERLFSLANEDWRLWLDSDEWLDEVAIQEIKKNIEEGGVKTLYTFERKAVVGGKTIKYAYFYPEYCKRLFNRNGDVCLKKGKKVHEDLVGFEVKKISGIIYHIWSEKYGELIKKDNYYLNLTIQGKENFSFKKKIKVAFVNLQKGVKVILKSVFIYCRRGFGASLPISYAWRFARYHFIYAKKVIFIKPNHMLTIKELRQICQNSEEAPSWRTQSIEGKMNRIFSIYVTWFLIKLPISPTPINILGTLFYLAGAFLFIFQGLKFQIAGLILMFISFILDACDGEMARYQKLTKTKAGLVGGAYIEPVSHDIMYGFFFLPVGLGATAASGNLLPMIAAFSATVFKLIFRLLECRNEMLGFYGFTPPPASDADAAPKKSETLPTISYFIYRNFFTGTGIFFMLILAVAVKKIDYFLYFYAVSFFFFWVYKMFKQWKRIKKQMVQL